MFNQLFIINYVVPTVEGVRQLFIIYYVVPTVEGVRQLFIIYYEVPTVEGVKVCVWACAPEDRTNMYYLKQFCIHVCYIFST